jgi:hypothetical protein
VAVNSYTRYVFNLCCRNELLDVLLFDYYDLRVLSLFVKLILTQRPGYLFADFLGVRSVRTSNRTSSMTECPCNSETFISPSSVISVSSFCISVNLPLSEADLHFLLIYRDRFLNLNEFIDRFWYTG